MFNEDSRVKIPAIIHLTRFGYQYCSLKQLEWHESCNIYYRQRFILFLLEVAGGELSRMDVQKLVFLHEEELQAGHFDCIPCHYGAYFFQCDDIDLPEKRSWKHLRSRIF